MRRGERADDERTFPCRVMKALRMRVGSQKELLGSSAAQAARWQSEWRRVRSSMHTCAQRTISDSGKCSSAGWEEGRVCVDALSTGSMARTSVLSRSAMKEAVSATSHAQRKATARSSPTGSAHTASRARGALSA